MLQLVLWGQPYSYNWPFEGNHNADMALSEKGFGTPGLKERQQGRLHRIQSCQRRIKHNVKRYGQQEMKKLM